MTVRSLCDKFRLNIENCSTGMMSSFFQRTTLLQNLCHAKQLLITHGTESFKESFTKIFTLDKKDQKKAAFAKLVKKSEEYKNIELYIDDAL